MSMEKMLVFGYARVSTDNQLENYSIEEQTSRLEAFCAAKGWTLLHTYVDGGYSGGNTDRPALQEMLRAIRKDKIDAVIVYKLDRLSRSQKDTLTLIEDELLAHGTDFVSINENFDTSTPFGRAMIGILSVFAQLEKDQITERFTMGRIGRSKAGYFHGGPCPPTGYNYVGGELVINEYEAIQVQELFDLFLSGKSLNAIQRHLNENYTTKWSAAKVRYALTNSTYIGNVQFCKQEYAGQHRPIIDKTTFTAAGALLHSSNREAKKNTAQKNPFRAGYLLSGLVYCGHCGARYHANHGYYKCYSRAKSAKKFVVDPDCKNDNWRIDELDGIVVDMVNDLIANPNALESILRAVEQDKTVKIDKSKLIRRVAEIDNQISRLVDLYQLREIPMETITDRINDLSKERKQLQQHLDAPEEARSTDLFQHAVAAYQQGFQSGDTDHRRALLAALIDRIIVTGRSVEINWRI